MKKTGFGSAVKTMAKRAGRALLKKLIMNPYVLSGIVFFLLFIFIIIVTLGTVSYAVSGILGSNKDVSLNNMKTAVSQMPEELKSNIAAMSLINPDILLLCMEEEKNSVPETIKSQIGVSSNGGPATKSEYILDVRNVAWPYRLYWQELAAFHAYGVPLGDTNIAENAKRDLAPVLSWADQRFTEDVTICYKTNTKTYQVVDGVKKLVSSTDSTPTWTTTYYPLPYLDYAETPFRKYKFLYTEDVVVRDTGWEEESRTTTTNADGTVIKVATKYKKTKIVRDMPSGIKETDDPSRFIGFMAENDISPADLNVIYGIASQLPDSNDFLDQFETVMGLYRDSNLLDNSLNIYDSSIDLENLKEYPAGNAGIPYYNQTDIRWGHNPYGYSGTIKTSGCGPTSLAMVISGLKRDKSITPDIIAKWSVENGYRAEGRGSYWSLMVDGGVHWGLKVRTVSRQDTNVILEALSQGHPVIAAMGPGHFTRGGHFIVLRGLTNDNRILVYDPASVNRSNIEWDASVIFNESSTAGGQNGCPFWIFTNE